MLNDESVLRNANGLDPRVKDIINGWYISLFSNPCDLIKETIGYEAGSVWVNENRVSPLQKLRVRGNKR
jgi:hypothetical protein